jgi:hypothetical protein
MVQATPNDTLETIGAFERAFTAALQYPKMYEHGTISLFVREMKKREEIVHGKYFPKYRETFHGFVE